MDLQADLLVLGAGPGGYPAAFRAADLGLNVTLVERWPVLGGVCLNVGCIPSKALLHAAKVIEEAESMAECGVTFGQPQIDLDGLRGWKDKVVGKLTGGLATLAKQRKVAVVKGTGRFLSAHHLEVTDGDTRAGDCLQDLRDRRRLRAGAPAGLPRGSAHHRLHRRPGAEGPSPRRCW